MKELLTLLIVIGQSFQVSDADRTVNMVCFSGSASGQYFKGDILPGGVDTQTYLSDGSHSLSARYMLQGTDSLGQPCRVYIDNRVERDTPPGESRPSIVTDSEFLRTKASQGLTGRMEFKDSSLVIHILTLPKKEK